MNVHQSSHMRKDAFLEWVQGRQERYELAHGRVIMMTGGTRGHALVVRRLANALEKRLDAARWAVLTSDFGVSVGPETVRYPDVIVDESGGRLKDLTATSPALIAEVLSPSSVTDDLGDKAAEYLHLQSLHAYLVLSQEEAKVWAWVRSGSGFPAGSEVITGQEGVVYIPRLGIEFPLSEIYASFPTTNGNN
jgi:Uma2 family endonuclease